MTEMNERQVNVIDEDGAQTVTLIQVQLGLTPFILLHCEEVDPNGHPIFQLKYGGGLSISDVPAVLHSLLENLERDLAAGLTDDDISGD